MTEWLVRRFVANCEDVSSATVRSAYGRLASVVSIVCNVVLALGKAAIGLAVGSVAVLADAANNLADAASNVVSLLGFKLAAKPPDAEHPYGHGRYEYLATLLVAVGVMLVGVDLVRDSVARIAKPSPVDASMLAMGMLVVSIAVKLWMACLNAVLGARIESSVLAATAADSLGDSVATAAVLATLIVTRAGGPNLDGWTGLGVGALITWGGIGLIRDTIDTLLGRAPAPELVERIRSHIVGTPGVLGVHGLMVHDYGPGRLFASAHVEMSPTGDVVTQHELVDAIERELRDTEGIVMTLHIDPIERGDGSVTDLATSDANETDGGPAKPHGRHGAVMDMCGGTKATGTRPAAKGGRQVGYKSKQMIVVRRDLKMRKGKIAAQAGHACVEATLMALAHEGRLSDIRMTSTQDWVYLDGDTDSRSDATPLTSWFDAGVAKVCVYVDGEDALLDLAKRGRDMGFLCALVRDAGITEFGGEPTYTCLAFEPLYPEQVDPLTGELPLY